MPAGDAAGGNGRTFVSPVVARIAAEHGVDPAQSTGTGTGGRVTKKDILSLHRVGGAGTGRRARCSTRARRGSGRARCAGSAARCAGSGAGCAGRRPADPVCSVRSGSRCPCARRRGIAVADGRGRGADDRDAPWGDGAHAPLARHLGARHERDRGRHVPDRRCPRARLKKEYQASYGVNPTYLAFIAHATVETLKDYPWLNAEIRGEKIVTRAWVNLGIAVALEDGKGLIVPVIKNAQDLNLLGMARAIADLATRARTKKLLPDDVQGGTFTITNPGGFGTFHGTPIISQPQVGILGTYALVKRPWVVQDELGQDVIAIRPLMNLTLTYDHRLVDGAYSGGFLRDLRQRLEAWEENG